MDKEGSAARKRRESGRSAVARKAETFLPQLSSCLSWFPRFSGAGKKKSVGGVTRARRGADHGGEARGRRESPSRTSRAPPRVSGTLASPRVVAIAILGSVFSCPMALRNRKRVEKKAAGKAGGARRATARPRGGGSRVVGGRVTELGGGTHLLKVRGTCGWKRASGCAGGGFSRRTGFSGRRFSRNVGAQANSLR